MPIPTRETVVQRVGEPPELTIDRIAKYLTDNLGQFILPTTRIPLVNGDNNNIDLRDAILVTITGPTAAYAITGIGGGSGGRIVIIRNSTGQVLTFNHEDTASTAPNRIVTDSGADTAADIALLVYDESDPANPRWYMVAMPGTAGSPGAPGADGTIAFEKMFIKFWKQFPSATTLVAIGGSVPTQTGGGGITSFNDSTGAYVNHSTTTGANTVAGWTDAERSIAMRQLGSHLMFVVKTGAAASDIANIRFFAMATTNTIGGGDVPGFGSAGFRYSTSVPDTNWQAITTTAGGVATTTDTGVAVAVDTRYELEIDMRTSGHVIFSINGTVVADHTTNLPALTADLLTGLFCVNLSAGTARNIRIAGMTMESF